MPVAPVRASRHSSAVIGIGIVGARGRMGQAIAAELAGRDDAQLAVSSGRGESLAGVASGSDVIIDFSSPQALLHSLESAEAFARPLVVGTTGLGVEHGAAIDRAARTIPVLQAANMSLGVNLLAYLVREAAARLGPDWDVEIAEMHHRHKVDAPSGTALLLGEAAAAGRGIDLATHSDRRRHGIGAPRAQGAIGFASLRGGSVAGDHLVVLAGEGERIELGHRAESRVIFARGAIRAALWLHDRPPGRYNMNDVLGIDGSRPRLG